MNEFQSRIAKRTRAEARYLRGYQCMNLERFRYYQDAFRAAYDCGDVRKMHELVQDSVTITNDTIRLIRKRVAITARRSFTTVNDAASPPDVMQLPPPVNR